jgi:hypothetical protein
MRSRRSTGRSSKCTSPTSTPATSITGIPGFHRSRPALFADWDLTATSQRCTRSPRWRKNPDRSRLEQDDFELNRRECSDHVAPLAAGLSRERTQVIQMTQVRSLESRVLEISKDASAASTCYDSKKFSRDSPALAGRGRIATAMRSIVRCDPGEGDYPRVRVC